MRDIEGMIDDVLLREGGYVNHPADRGGPTNYGITQATLSRYRGRPATLGDVIDLTRDEAREIYRSDYLIAPRLHVIKDPEVLALAFDCSINHGPGRIVRWLQQAVEVVDDGKLGPVSEAAINTIDPVKLYERVLAKRFRFIGEVITNDPEARRAKRAGYNLQAAFAKGWLARYAEFITRERP